MGYVNYNHALYRTGFRPYGHTNAWAASQLNGMSIHEATLGQSHPFEAGGGWRLHGLGQSRAFAPWTLHGGMAVCLDEKENTVACMDPSCTYGDCGSNAEQQVGGPLCLDHGQNQIACSSPDCTYGDCIGPKAPSPVTINLPPGPSPRVGVPPGWGAPTSPGYAAPASGLMASTIISGVPNILLYGAAVFAAIQLLSPGGRRR
jgi:hypothetical protein